MKKEHRLIVGGTKGIGRALARLWAGQGHAVTVLGRSGAPLPGVASLAADLGDPARAVAAAHAAVKKAGELSALVFCQRWRGQGDAWEGELAVSLTGTKVLLEALADSMAPGGAALVVGTAAIPFAADDQGPGYHAAKAALRSLVRYYAAAWGPRGRRVNMLSPGLVLKEEAKEFYAKRTDLAGLFARITPLGRMGGAEEMAAAADFLCGPQASFVTGVDLVADGGLTLAYAPALARRVLGVK